MIANSSISSAVCSAKPFIFIAILSLFLIGCSSTPRVTEPLLFATDGKISVREGTQGRSGRFSFNQYADSVVLEVWGPLGQGRLRLTGNERQLILTRGDKILAQGRAADLMQDQLGWYVPLDVFSAWLQGAPHGDYPFEWDQRNSEQSSFHQLNWQVELSRFNGASDVNAQPEPGRIDARSGNLRVLLVTRS